MIRDGSSITTPQSPDVCIIGSGPAGITAAWELQKTGRKVLLIDGSRARDYTVRDYYRQSWPDKVQLYNGVADGVFAESEPDFLIRPYDGFGNDNPSERERVYGGTSTHWGGQSRPLDPIAFEKRPGFPGWPISRHDLDPYYRRTSELCHLLGDYGASGDNFTAEFWKKQLDAEIPRLPDFDVEMYQFVRGSNPNLLNFAVRDFDGTQIGDTDVDVVVNASLIDIVHQGGVVRHLEVASMKEGTNGLVPDTRFTITAQVFILACGAVANARQLLLSEVGNDHVGRYFMGHALSRSSVVETTEQYLTPDEKKMLQGYAPIPNSVPPHPTNFAGIFIAKPEAVRERQIGRCWFWGNNRFGRSQMYFELSPNPESRVTLSDRPDPVFGQPQTHIRWCFNDLDRRTYEENIALFNTQFPDRFPGGIVDAPTWDEMLAGKEWTINGHHIGTTRMSAADRPDDGVVDPDLKVHGMDNLYVAGSSVYPTAGISNPTMTVITLSIRLADHVGGRLA